MASGANKYLRRSCWRDEAVLDCPAEWAEPALLRDEEDRLGSIPGRGGGVSLEHQQEALSARDIGRLAEY